MVSALEKKKAGKGEWMALGGGRDLSRMAEENLLKKGMFEQRPGASE